MVYPVRNKLIASARLKVVKEDYEKRGYRVIVFNVEDEGIDVIAENEKEVIGLEIVNWNREGYLNLERFLSMCSNWMEHEKRLRESNDHRIYKRRLVYSYFSNIRDFYESLREFDVELEQYGFQHLPTAEEKMKIVCWC